MTKKPVCKSRSC